MNTKRYFLTLVIAAIAMAQMPAAIAQSEQHARQAEFGWAAIARSGQTASAEQPSETNQDLQIAQAASIESQAVDPKKRIVGTWVITV